MSEKTREVSYLVCDACGYAISAKTDPYLVLTMKDPREESTDLHFHIPEKVGEHRSWGTKDCLHYWITSRVAHAHSQGWDGRGKDGLGPSGAHIRDVAKGAP